MGIDGQTSKLSTRDIDKKLAKLTPVQLASVHLSARMVDGHDFLYIRLPDETIVYDHSASRALEQPVWHRLTSGEKGYRGAHIVNCYGKWNVADTLSGAIGVFSDKVSTHWGDKTTWEFGTPIAYNEGSGAIVHEMTLFVLNGTAKDGAVVLTDHSEDGVNWSQVRPCSVGSRGDGSKQMAWRRQGRLRHSRMQRFRGNSDARITATRLDILPEGLI